MSHECYSAVSADLFRVYSGMGLFNCLNLRHVGFYCFCVWLHCISLQIMLLHGSCRLFQLESPFEVHFVIA